MYYSWKKLAPIVFRHVLLKSLVSRYLFSFNEWIKKLSKLLLDLKVFQRISYKRFLNFAACAELIVEYTSNTDAN